MRASLHGLFDRALARSCATVSTMMVLGDATAQQVEFGVSQRTLTAPTDRIVTIPGTQAHSHWNVSRSGRMGLIGLISAGPMSHLTYVLCAQFWPQTSWTSVGKRVAAVITLNSPIQITSTFMLVTLLAGYSVADAANKVHADLLSTWAVNNCYWPPILALNMKFVPVAQQASVGAVFHAIWNVALSVMANRTVAECKQDTREEEAHETRPFSSSQTPDICPRLHTSSCTPDNNA